MKFIIDTENLNDLQIASIRKFMALVKHGAKFVDIEVRKDGKDYRFEGDWLWHIKEDTKERGR